MSTFALVNSNAGSHLLVGNVHLNLFILPGILGRYRILVEIGLHFACETDDGKTHELDGFELELPFIMPDGSTFEDVSTRLTDATNLRMIFGKCKENDGLITWSTGINEDGSPVETTAKLVPVRRDDGTKCLNKDAAASRSFWHFKVNQKLTKSKGLYIRLRFSIADQRIWRWHRGSWDEMGPSSICAFRTFDPWILQSSLLKNSVISEDVTSTLWFHSGWSQHHCRPTRNTHGSSKAKSGNHTLVVRLIFGVARCSRSTHGRNGTFLPIVLSDCSVPFEHSPVRRSLCFSFSR
jgi:hypothetical protein